MSKDIKVIKKGDYATSTWSGGTTSEICIYPEDAIYKDLNFNYRISSATVDVEESNFTKLDGVYRFITPLDGELKLTHDNTNFVNLNAFEVYEFKGDIDTNSYGKVRDFNLMLANGTDGKLENHLIKDELKIKTSKESVDHIVLFSYDKDVTITIDNNDYKISGMEAIVVKADEDVEMDIKVEEESNILVSTMKIK